MITSLDLPDETFRQLQVRADLCGLKLAEMVNQLIERGLANTSPPTSSGERPPFPVAIVRDPNTPISLAPFPMTQALTHAQLCAILEEEDLANYLPVLRQRENPWEPLQAGLAAFEPGFVLTRPQPDEQIRDEICP